MLDNDRIADGSLPRRSTLIGVFMLIELFVKLLILPFRLAWELIVAARVSPPMRPGRSSPAVVLDLAC